MANKKPPIKNKILEDYLINGSHDLKSIGGLVVSGIVSTFGVYSVIRPFFTSTSTLNTALIAFVIVLIIFDTVKRGAFTKFFNSLLKKKIIESKVKKGYLVIAIFATVFMIGLDTLGSWSTAEKGAGLYTQFKTNSSTEYKILQQNAENGKQEASNYPLLLETWKQSKKEAYQNCNDTWKGWKPKYKAKCKKKWDNAKDKNGNLIHAMPQPTSNGQIKLNDYENIKGDKEGFLDEYLFIILFILLSLMTLLMQYLTIAKIYDDYNDIEEGLTFERIEFINDTIQEHETILAEHEQKVAELMADSTREKKGKDRKFQEIGEAIAITHKQKMNDTRAETVKRIANNVYVPKEESKAGFVHNPFNESVSDEAVKRNRYNEEQEKNPQNDQPLNETVITDKEVTEPLNGVVKRIDLKEFSNDDLKLIDLLWKHSTVKRNDQLETRDNVIKVIGDNKNNTLRLSNLYKKLLKLDYIYKRVGYFAKVELPQEKNNIILNPFHQIEELKEEILTKVKAKFSDVNFVSIKSNYNNTKLIISVFFNGFQDGEAITYFGDGEKDYNKPINPQLEKRCSAVYKILKPYLGVKQ